MRLIGAKLSNKDKIRRVWKDIPIAERQTILFVFFSLVFGMATPRIAIGLYRYFAGLQKANAGYAAEIFVLILSGALYICAIVLVQKRWSTNAKKALCK